MSDGCLNLSFFGNLESKVGSGAAAARPGSTLNQPEV